MCVSHWQALQHYFFVMFRDQSSEESSAHQCSTLAISAWRSALGSTRLWHVGLIKGMKCLDIGCGGGHVTILMAHTVGPEGRVIGTDTDAKILALAREDAKAAKATNVEFQQRDACASLWHNEFNVAYARFLLSHLNEPGNCLAAMRHRSATLWPAAEGGKLTVVVMNPPE